MRLLASAIAAFGESGAFGGDIHGKGDSWDLAKRIKKAPSGKSAIPTISVVDDDEDLHLFLKDLGALGHFNLIGSFYNAAQALDRLPAERPDAVIMDIRLPDMSGIDCTGKLRTVFPELPIIMLTGYATSQNFFRALMEGAKGFLVKPVSAQEFLSAIDEVLRGEFALAKQVVPFLVHMLRQFRQVAQENRLTRREEEILACLFEGMKDKEIASEVGIGPATVLTHMQHHRRRCESIDNRRR